MQLVFQCSLIHQRLAFGIYQPSVSSRVVSIGVVVVVVVDIMATTSTQPGVYMGRIKLMCRNKPGYQDAAARLQAAY